MTVNRKNLRTVLILLIIMMILLVITITAMNLSFLRDIWSVFVPGILLSILGIPVLILGIRSDASKLTRIFIILAGASAISIALGSVLHNLVTAAISSLSGRMIEEPVFFIISLLIAPVGFLTGAIGTFARYSKEK